MSASEFVNVGSSSSDECSANAKATLFLASSKRHDSNSYGTQSNKSFVLESAGLGQEVQASSRVFADCGLTCILDQHPQRQCPGYDDMCLSPLAYEGRCRSLASCVAASKMCTSVNQVCDSNHGPSSWPFSSAATIQNFPIWGNPTPSNCFR